MCTDGEVIEEMRKSHRGMVDGCRWRGGGNGVQDVECLSEETSRVSSKSQIIFGSDQIYRHLLLKCQHQCQLNRLHDENEAPKGKNASPRTLTDIMTSTFYPNKIPPPYHPLCPAPLLLAPLRILLYIILCVTRSAS
jgi:hypothetical protein